MLEDLGNCIKINGTVIPAVNIQVEGYPRWHEEHLTWYGIYFEIMFENGDLWEVEQMLEDLNVEIRAYHDWVNRDAGFVTKPCKIEYPNWKEFLNLYHLKLAGVELIKHIHWSEYGQWEAA